MLHFLAGSDLRRQKSAAAARRFSVEYRLAKQTRQGGCRAMIDDDIRPIYTEKRLSRNMDDETLEESVAEAVLRDGARSVTRPCRSR